MTRQRARTCREGGANTHPPPPLRVVVQPGCTHTPRSRFHFGGHLTSSVRCVIPVHQASPPPSPFPPPPQQLKLRGGRPQVCDKIAALREVVRSLDAQLLTAAQRMQVCGWVCAPVVRGEKLRRISQPNHRHPPLVRLTVVCVGGWGQRMHTRRRNLLAVHATVKAVEAVSHSAAALQVGNLHRRSFLTLHPNTLHSLSPLPCQLSV